MADETNDPGASALDDLKAALDDLQLIDADRKRATKRVRDVLRRSKLDLEFESSSKAIEAWNTRRRADMRERQRR